MAFDWIGDIFTGVGTSMQAGFGWAASKDSNEALLDSLGIQGDNQDAFFLGQRRLLSQSANAEAQSKADSYKFIITLIVILFALGMVGLVVWKFFLTSKK